MQLESIGEEVYRTWSHEQCSQEIGNLVQGFKSGLPVQILCQLATSIAGTPELAREHLAKFLSLKERKEIVKKESGSNKQLRTLLQSTLIGAN
jgi:hypothetical protein